MVVPAEGVTLSVIQVEVKKLVVSTIPVPVLSVSDTEGPLGAAVSSLLQDVKVNEIAKAAKAIDRMFLFIDFDFKCFNKFKIIK